VILLAMLIEAIPLDKPIRNRAMSPLTECLAMLPKVPAYFGADQRDATAQAGNLAGLEVVKLIR
jgi:molecular chaperone DnaK (HSP70)